MKTILMAQISGVSDIMICDHDLVYGKLDPLVGTARSQDAKSGTAKIGTSGISILHLFCHDDYFVF